MSDIETKRYEDLANAIIEKAAQDYEKAVRYLRKNGEETKSKKTLYYKRIINDVERFFLGRWIETLTSVDGAKLFEQIKANVESKIPKEEQESAKKS